MFRTTKGKARQKADRVEASGRTGRPGHIQLLKYRIIIKSPTIIGLDTMNMYNIYI